MTNRIGFTANGYVDKKEVFSVYGDGEMCSMPRKSMVDVYFSAKNITLTYFNDKFDLKCGDFVYVEGKLEGVQGRVTGVNYNFKIKVSDHKRVIAVVDTNVSGKLFMAGSHFVTFDPSVLPSEKILTWFKAPTVDDDVYISGSDDTTFVLDDLSGLNVTPMIADRGCSYYKQNRVRYICLDGSKGYAIIEGTEAYEIDFEYRGGEISGLTCSCFCSFNCKHEFAAMLQLKETLELVEKNYSDEFERTGYFAAIAKTILFNFAIDGKEKGGFVL